MAIADSTMETDLATARGIPRSAYFALFVLVLTNLFNMLDRSIVSILAQSIKADLKLTDADLGFLLGTAFAVFYSVVGIAMGRISVLTRPTTAVLVAPVCETMSTSDPAFSSSR